MPSPSLTSLQISSFRSRRAASGCEGCRNGSFDLPITMAFQPIVDIQARRVFAYEALVRGVRGEGAGWVLGQVHEGNRYGFDQTCRARAIQLAAKLNLPATGARLSINFMPNAVYRPEDCIRGTFAAARRNNFPLASILFEMTEGEKVENPGHLKRVMSAYREMGFTTAIDDFGAGHSGLNLLADFQPDIIKLDMQLVRGADGDRARRAILRGIVATAAEMDLRVIAEGIETTSEYETLRDLGVRLFQGYLFAKPGFETLPEPDYQDGAAPAPAASAVAAGAIN